MTQIVDLRDFLDDVKEISFISELPENLRDSVCSIFTHVCQGRRMAKGETLYKKGAKGENTGALLVSGAVKISVGNKKPLLKEAPDLFGELMQYDKKGRRTATITMAEDSIVFEFPWHAFISMALQMLTTLDQIKLKKALADFAGDRMADLTDHAQIERAQYMDSFEDIAFLSDLPEDLCERVRDIFVSISECFTVFKGQVLYEKGEKGLNTGAVLVQGSVMVDKGGPDSKVCEAPELFGEMMQFDDGHERTANVTANESSLFFTFSWNDFLAAAAVRLSKQEQQELRQALQRSVDTRLAELLESAQEARASEPAQKP